MVWAKIKDINRQWDYVMNTEIAQIFNEMPKAASNNLLKIRDLILKLSNDHPDIGKIDECLKWGEPSYVTHSPRTGTTVRLAWKSKTNTYGIYVPCQTTIIEDFKQVHGDDLRFDKNRGILFSEKDTVPEEQITTFLIGALTYHNKK